MSVINESWIVEERDDPYADFRILCGHALVAKVFFDDAPVHDYNAAQMNRLQLILAAPDLLRALYWAQRLTKEVLPKFNWGASALDANAIHVLNMASLEIDKLAANFSHAFRHMEER